MKVGVIGAGWFGCHIASELVDQGFDVVLYEKCNDIFSQASFYNTGRLHQGFHYPRSAKTRTSCATNFNTFQERYGFLCGPVEDNLYLISATDSLIDYSTYLDILKASQLQFAEIAPKDYGIQHVEGGVICQELAINPVKAKDYFKKKLAKVLRLNTPITNIVSTNNGVILNNENFDYCINCTYSTFLPSQFKPSLHIEFEHVVSLILQKKIDAPDLSFVVMDGEFISLNKSFINSPSSSPLYSLYHVKESVVFASKDYAETLTHVKSTQDKETHELVDVTKFKQAIQHYYPAFEDTFEIKGHTTTIRTKMVNKDANRECVMCQNERYINILSGKISSIFEASEAVQQAIESRSVYSVNK